MGYKKQQDGTIVKVNYRTRLKRPRGRRAHLLTPRPKTMAKPQEGPQQHPKE